MVNPNRSGLLPQRLVLVEGHCGSLHDLCAAVPDNLEMADELGDVNTTERSTTGMSFKKAPFGFDGTSYLRGPGESYRWVSHQCFVLLLLSCSSRKYRTLNQDSAAAAATTTAAAAEARAGATPEAAACDSCLSVILAEKSLRNW